MSDKITKSAQEKMQQELARLKAKREKISKAIGEAREHGDLKENSAYHAAKEEQGLNEMRIRDLETRLENAEVVSEKDLPKKDTVGLNSKVKIMALDTKATVEYTIVSEAEADVFLNKISSDSPLGEAIIGCKKGEVVKVDAPRGVIQYKVLEIK